MKKKILVVVTLLLTLFTITSCVTKKETLATPQNVKVSESGLVTWDAVENAEKYVVICKYENTSDEKTVTETKYQIENVDVNSTVTVYAKASNYNDSEKSEAVEFLALNQKEVNELVEDLIDNFLGEKDPDLSDELSALYDKNAKYFKEVAKKAVKLGYKEEVSEEIVDMLGSSSDIFGIFTSAINVLNLYNKEQIVSTLYAMEIGCVGQLFTLRQMVSVYQPDLVSYIDELVSILQEGDVELVEHIYNMLVTAKSLVTTLTPVISQLGDIVSAFEDGTLDAKTVNTFKNNVVKALKTNALEEDDLTYVVTVVVDLSDVVLSVFDYGITSGEFDFGDSQINALVYTYYEMFADLLPEKEDINVEELVKGIQDSYFGVLDFIETGITEEFIEEILSKEDILEMVTTLAVAGLQALLPEPSEIGKIDATLTLSMIDSVLKQVFGNDFSITEAFGLSEEQIKAYLEASADLEESIYTLVYNVINSEGIVDAIYSALKFSNSLFLVDSCMTTDSFVVYDDVIDYSVIPNYVQEFMTKYDITEFFHGFSERTYTIVDSIQSTENGATVAVRKLIYQTHLYEAQEKETEYDIEITVNVYYEITYYTVENAEDILPLVKILVKEYRTLEEPLLGMINTLLNILPSLTLPGGTLPQEAEEILAIIGSIDEGSFDKMYGIYFDLVEKVAEYLETIDLNKLVLILELSDDIDFSEFQNLVQSFGTAENRQLMKDLISEVANVIEKLDLFEEIGYNSKADFVNETNQAIDEFFQVTVE